jgi:hypothetical protein
MDTTKIIFRISLMTKLLLLITIIYYKLRGLYKISFNSFYLLIFNISSLFLFQCIFLIPSLSSDQNLYIIIALIVFIFSYILRLIRIFDCLSLSKIIKSSKIEDKSKALYSKSYYSFESFYLTIFIISSLSIFMLFYHLKKIKEEKYVLFIISIIAFILFCIKIALSDIILKLKKNYLIEIISWIIYVSNILFISEYIKFYQLIFTFFIDFIFLIMLCINCGIFSKKKIYEKDFIANNKLKNDFYLFFNNELCFHVFKSYLDKNKSDAIIILKLYIDINRYKIKCSLDGDSNDAISIINYYDSNKDLIKDLKLKEKINNIMEMKRQMMNDNKFENNMFDEILNIINNNLNDVFKVFKKKKEFEKLFSLLDLIHFLDEYIFVESFYFDYINNEELQNVE